jgi:hypothetical protein
MTFTKAVDKLVETYGYGYIGARGLVAATGLGTVTEDGDVQIRHSIRFGYQVVAR